MLQPFKLSRFKGKEFVVIKSQKNTGAFFKAPVAE